MTTSPTLAELAAQSDRPAKILQCVLIASITWLSLRVGYRFGYTDGQRSVIAAGVAGFRKAYAR